MANLKKTASDTKSLYATQEKIYPREVKGKFQRIRRLCVYALLGIYYGLPWLSWDEHQAVLFDLPARKFHIFFLTMWPQDFFFLTLLMILGGLSLFFFTALAGRVWCGYACPQTIWTEAFIWMERWVEGDRNKQIKLTKSPWNAVKIRKRALKQLLWISFAFFTGITFVGYFEPIKTLFNELWTMQLTGWSLFWVFFYSAATYGNAGFLREQVCQYMCPYARFQSAMFDKDTLLVSYDIERGEPRIRGKKRRENEPQAGDCIDCGLCVQVCPTGIDIRDGLQYECIACAACIDVCDDVMESVGFPKGLVKYSTESLDDGEDKSLFKTLVRPRTLMYAVLLSIIAIGFTVSLFMRSNFQVDVMRDRNTLYRMADGQTVENTYHIKVMNKSQHNQHYRIELQGLIAGQVRWLRTTQSDDSKLVKAGEIGDFIALVQSPLKEQKKQSQLIQLVITETDSDKPDKIIEDTRFWGPKVK